MIVSNRRPNTRPMDLEPSASPVQTTIGVLIVEDHQIVAEGLACLLSTSPDIQVVGLAATVQEAIARAEDRSPQVVLMDSRLRDGSGAQAAAQIHRNRPEIAIVFLSGFDSDDVVLAAMEAGACGFLSKDSTGREVLAAVRGAAKGHLLISSQRLTSLMSYQRDRQARAARQTQLLDYLTGRERDVLELLAGGLDNRRIAARLGIGYATVRTHVQSVLEKIGAHSRLEAVLRAGAEGLLMPSPPAGEQDRGTRPQISLCNHGPASLSCRHGCPGPPAPDHISASN